MTCENDCIEKSTTFFLNNINWVYQIYAKAFSIWFKVAKISISNCLQKAIYMLYHLSGMRKSTLYYR